MNRTYTQEQHDIEMLKSKTDSIGQTLERIDRRLETMDANIKSQYSNFTNYILGIYGLMLTTILAHIGGIF